MKFRRLRLRKSLHKTVRPNNEKSSLLHAFTQLLLVLAGGLIGVLGNQFFFERNRKLETSLEMQRDFLKQQLPLYNRILNFTYSQELGGYRKVTSEKIDIPLYNPFNLIYARDTIVKYDTTEYQFPSFIVDSSRLSGLLNDFKILNDNKDKIDPHVWGHFANLEAFLINHPIPKSNIPEIIVRSQWADTNTYKQWRELNAKLYLAAYEKLQVYLVK